MSESHQVNLAVDIECRQDEVLRLLDELNERIERTLADLPSLKLRAPMVRQEQKRAA